MRALLAALALVPLAATGAAEVALVQQTEDLLVVRVRSPLPEVLAAVEAALARHNYPLAATNHLDETLRERAAGLGLSFDFDHYKILSFCNLTLADEALRADPAVGVFMPCRLALFARKGDPEVVIVTMRPTFLSRVFKSASVERLARRVEADVVAILEMIAADLR